ncbi:MAG TPA: hypothetical protein VFV38_17540 [Ktedonobacteraceae bacterium]|nr:hypothetical protein [Ktedonobacteraceae bacterium]
METLGYTQPNREEQIVHKIQILAQWIWNLQLELGHALTNAPLRPTDSLLLSPVLSRKKQWN